MGKYFTLLFTLALFMSQQATSQGLAESEIYILQMSVNDTGGFKFSSPRNMTNSAGYDNQPYFSFDGKFVLYSSNRDGNAEVYKMFPTSGQSTRITFTPYDEFSPSFHPNQSSFSSVQVGKDSLQQVVRFTMKGQVIDTLSSGYVKVGYHNWLNDTTLAVMVLDKPDGGGSLHLLGVRENSFGHVADNIGRCLQPMPLRTSVLYIDKADPKWPVIEYNFKTQKKSVFGYAMAGNEDFAVTADLKLLCVSGHTIYQLSPQVSKTEWKAIEQLPAEMPSFYRIAVSPTSNFLALVSYSGLRP